VSESDGLRLAAVRGILGLPLWEDGDADRERRRWLDFHHLAGHILSLNDAFVTSDQGRAFTPRRRRMLREDAGIEVLDPHAALQRVRAQLQL